MIVREIRAELLLDWVSKHGSIGRVERKWAWFHKDQGDKRTLLPLRRAPYLYRGQTRRYAPLLPSISRGISIDARSLRELPEADQSELLVRLVRADWFCNVLGGHPVITWANKEGVYIDVMALAQHYGVATGYLDLSESLEIGMFFACCEFDGVSYTPCSDGRGILYRVDLTELPPGRVRPIGMQPFPRPYEQWAWTLEMSLGEDFEELPGIEAVEFEHSADVGERILELLDGGRLVLPDDPISEWATHVNEVGRSALPLSRALAVLRDVSEDPKGLIGMEHSSKLARMTDETGIHFRNDDMSFVTSEEMVGLAAQWEELKPTFLDSLEENTQLYLVRARK